jgi:integrase
VASFSKTAKGWRVQVARKGVRLSRTFVTKRAAELWAAEQERAIIDGEVSKYPRKTVQQALDRYAEEVSPTKGSAKAERLRFLALCRDFPTLAAKPLADVTPADIAAWRDTMLRRVKPSTVKRMANSLRAVWTLAGREWGWCGESPFASVKIPADGPPRERVAGWREIRRILRRCDYVTHHPPVSGLQNVAWAFLLALRTAMRAGEVLSLTVGSVSGSVVTVKHKTQYLTGRPRAVPLTPQGLRLVRELAAFAQARGRQELLSITSASLDAQFRKVTSGLMIEDLTFHDSRGTALTHMARKLEVMELARVSGHRDIRILFNSYYRVTPQQIADKLAMPSVQRPRPATAGPKG